MKSIEPMDTRLKKVDMHQFFLNRIDKAVNNNNYIEAAWLIYACFENRYFSTISKFKDKCKYSRGKCKKQKNELALRTKIRCLQRLSAENCTCISNAYKNEIFERTLDWVKRRNALMHDLLQLDAYEDMDDQFKQISEEGVELLKETYDCCTEFRRLYFTDGYEFVFPEEAMEKCACKPRKDSEEVE